MDEQTDQQLLRNYVERQSESAFAELVRRHVDLVHSAALRMVCDAHLAEDVTQGAFVALAQNARELNHRPVLSGWLHRTAQNLASKVVRTEMRRRAREQEAAAMNELLTSEPDTTWKHIAPELDIALGELSEPDRDALLLRYFERKSTGEMANVLGISDEAAQKRVHRAVARLREYFAKRGVAVGASGLVGVISANAVQAAPVGLVITIPTAVGLAATTAAIATHSAMNWLNLKLVSAIVAAAITAGTATYLVQQVTASRLRSENEGLVARHAELISERDAALASATRNREDFDRLRKEESELLRLRGEIGVLRRQASELEGLRRENAQLQQLAPVPAAGSRGTNALPVVAKVLVTRVQQPQLMSEAQIRANIAVRVGDVFDPAAVDRDVRVLQGSGSFSNIRATHQPTDEGVVVNYLVQEKAKLTGIRFSGNTSFDEAALVKTLASKIGEPLDERTVFSDAQALQALLRASGYPRATASPAVNVKEDKGEGDVTFTITE